MATDAPSAAAPSAHARASPRGGLTLVRGLPAALGLSWVIALALLGLPACNHRGGPRPTPPAATLDAARVDAAVAGPTDAPSTASAQSPTHPWTPTPRRPRDHEAVALTYLDRLVDDGVPCKEQVDFVPHDERIGSSPLGSVDFRHVVLRRGCFSRNLFKGFLLDQDPAVVSCFHAATPGVAAAVTLRSFWAQPDRYESTLRLLVRTEVLHARGSPDFDVGVLQQCLDQVLVRFVQVSNSDGLPATLDVALVFLEPPGPAPIGSR